MLRQAFSSNARHVCQRRGFVSTVLLTRDWEKETFSALKREAKKRGLLQTGNKATLITRLQEFYREQALHKPPPVTQQARQASTTEVRSAPSPSSSQPTTKPTTYPQNVFNIKIPDTSIPVVAKPTPVPFVPDLWDSSKIKAESATTPIQDPSIPKVIAVAGQPGGVVSHNLYQPSGTPPDNSSSPALDSDEKAGHTLNSDEKAGLWALFGIFAGSWVLAGIFAPQSAFAETEHHDTSAPEKAVDTH